jgi:hypothetical protein
MRIPKSLLATFLVATSGFAQETSPQMPQETPQQTSGQTNATVLVAPISEQENSDPVQRKIKPKDLPMCPAMTAGQIMHIDGTTQYVDPVTREEVGFYLTLKEASRLGELKDERDRHKKEVKGYHKRALFVVGGKPEDGRSVFAVCILPKTPKPPKSDSGHLLIQTLHFGIN